MSQLSVASHDSFVSFVDKESVRNVWIFFLDPQQLGLTRKSSVGSLLSGTTALKGVNRYELKRKLSRVLALSSKYSGDDLRVRFRMHVEPFSVSRRRIYFVVIVESSDQLPHGLVDEMSLITPYYLRRKALRRGVQLSNTGQIKLSLHKALSRGTQEHLSMLASLADIEVLVELLKTNRESPSLPPWDVPSPSFLLGRDRYGRDCFAPIPTCTALCGNYMNFLGRILSSGAIPSSFIAVLPSTRSLEGLDIQIVEPDSIGFNLLHMVLTDLNLGLKIFSTWARILQKRISPQAIVDFLYGLVKSIRDGGSIMNFNSFADILTDDEIRTKLNIVQYDQFIDAFGSVLSLPLFNRWELSPLRRPGHVVINGENVTILTRLLLSSFLAQCRLKGIITGVVAICDADELPRSYPLTSLLEDIGNQGLLILSKTSYLLYENPLIDLLVIDKTAVPRDLSQLSPLDDEVIAESSSSPPTVINLLEETPVINPPSSSDVIVRFRAVDNVYDLFEEEEREQFPVESLLESYEDSEKDGQYSEFFSSEVTKWVILQYMSIGAPVSYEQLFEAVGRKLRLPKSTLEALEQEGKIAQRSGRYSLSAQTSHLIEHYRNQMMQLSEEYTEFIANSRLTRVEELVKIRERVQEVSGYDACLQWLKDIYHFLGVVGVDSFFRKKVLGYYIATKSVFKVHGKEVMASVLQRQILDLLMEVEVEIQLEMSSSIDNLQDDVQSTILRTLSELEREQGETTPAIAEEEDDGFWDVIAEQEGGTGDDQAAEVFDVEPSVDLNEEHVSGASTEPTAAVVSTEDESPQHLGRVEGIEDTSVHGSEPGRRVSEPEGQSTPASSPMNDELLTQDVATTQVVREKIFSLPVPKVSSGLGSSQPPVAPPTPAGIPKVASPPVPPPGIPDHSPPPLVGTKEVEKGQILGKVKFLRPNEIAFPGAELNNEVIYPSCVLGWSRIETESFLVNDFEFSRFCESVEYESLQSLSNIASEHGWYIKVGWTPRRETTDQGETAGEGVEPLTLSFPQDVLNELVHYFEGNLDADSETLIHTALCKYFILPLTGEYPGGDLERVVNVITSASGSEGANISTLDLTNEFSLNISLWKKYPDTEKRRQINRTIQQKFLNFLGKFRYNSRFVDELRNRL